MANTGVILLESIFLVIQLNDILRYPLRAGNGGSLVITASDYFNLTNGLFPDPAFCVPLICNI